MSIYVEILVRAPEHPPRSHPMNLGRRYLRYYRSKR